MTWLLARTKPRAEFRAAAALLRFDFSHHLFKHQITTVIRGRLTERLIPAFPSYLFIDVIDERRVLLDELWLFIGMLDFVSISGTTAVADKALLMLLAMAMPNDVLPVDQEEKARFRFGDRVQIITGSHAAFGCEGVYQCTVRPGRVMLLAPWLGRLVPIEVDENEIELVSRLKAAAKQRKRRGRRGGRRRRYFAGAGGLIVNANVIRHKQEMTAA